MIFEFLSPSTRGHDLGKKKKLYEQTFKTEQYFCFDYFNPQAKDSLVGFRLVSGRYEPIEPNEQGWLWSENLGLWVGTWQGTYKRDPSIWMRFYTKDGNLVLIESEAEQARAEVAEEKTQAQEARAEVAEEKAQAQEARAEVAETEAKALKAEVARLKALFAKQGIEWNG